MGKQNLRRCYVLALLTTKTNLCSQALCYEPHVGISWALMPLKWKKALKGEGEGESMLALLGLDICHSL